MAAAASPPLLLIRARQLVLIACYGLVLYFFASSLIVLNGLKATTLVIWLIQILPLVIFLSGLHRQRLRSYAWVSFVVLLYFMHGVLVAFDPARRWWGIIEVGLCTLLFVFLIVYIRQFRTFYKVGL